MEQAHKRLWKDATCTKGAQDQRVACVVLIYHAVKSHRRAKLGIKEQLKLLLLLINKYAHSAQGKENPNVYIRNCNLKDKAQFFFTEQQFLGKMQEKLFAWVHPHPGGNTGE